MPLLEIVRTTKTSPKVINDTLGLVSKLKKTPIVVGNCVGFTVNRIFSPYVQSAVFLAERGIDLYRIDRALERFGFPMGPFKMNDLSGLDIFAHVGGIMAAAYPDRVYTTTLVSEMIKHGRFGQKSSAGFYRYDGRTAVPDPEGVNPFLVVARRDANVQQTIDLVSDEEIVQMVLYPVINECCTVLDEGMVVRASDIDVGSVYGYSFPAWRGGVMKWAEREGYSKIAIKLQNWFHAYRVPLYRPCKYLLHLALSQ